MGTRERERERRIEGKKRRKGKKEHRNEKERVVELFIEGKVEAK